MFDFHSHFPAKDSIFCTSDIPFTTYSNTFALSLGLLPQFWSSEKQVLLLDSLSKDKSLLMGEVGLDKRFSATLSLEKQSQILRELLDFSKQTKRSVSLHCVRSTGLMLQILKEVNLPKGSVIWHSFNGSAETASALEGLGVVISVGPSSTLQSILNSHAVVESDYTGTSEKEYNDILEKNYERVALAYSMSVVQLEEICRERGKAFTNK